LETETKELGIAAGLQDRVIQTYGGVLYMDFDRAGLEVRGHGEYVRIERTLLPPLFLAYAMDPSNSGKIHSDVRRRFEENDPEVVRAMKTFAGFASQGWQELRQGRPEHLRDLMRDAFALRLKIFGEKALGHPTLRMVELAHQHGLTGTTTGSGGAIVGLAGSDQQNQALESAMAKEGFRFLRLQVGPEYSWAEPKASAKA
jgi:glucuronokinase